MIKKITKKAVRKAQLDNENGARKAVIEELFYDFNKSKTQVYATNFVRGLFFGLGSVIGGTLVIAMLIWALTAFGDIFPPLADFINNLTDTVEQRR